jgi:hypothetical protein
MEAKGLLPYSQEPATVPYLDPDASALYLIAIIKQRYMKTLESYLIDVTTTMK